MWTNFGDINFMDHGGCLAEPHWSEEELAELINAEDLKNEFDVFILRPVEQEGMVYAGLAMIDADSIDDPGWPDKREILSSLGLEEEADKPAFEIMTPMEWAVAVVEYYGIEGCGGRALNTDYPEHDECIITRQEAMDWMREIGAEEFI